MKHESRNSYPTPHLLSSAAPTFCQST